MAGGGDGRSEICFFLFCFAYRRQSDEIETGREPVDADVHEDEKGGGGARNLGHTSAPIRAHAVSILCGSQSRVAGKDGGSLTDMGAVRKTCIIDFSYVERLEKPVFSIFRMWSG